MIGRLAIGPECRLTAYPRWIPFVESQGGIELSRRLWAETMDKMVKLDPRTHTTIHDSGASISVCIQSLCGYEKPGDDLSTSKGNPVSSEIPLWCVLPMKVRGMGDQEGILNSVSYVSELDGRTKNFLGTTASHGTLHIAPIATTP